MPASGVRDKVGLQEKVPPSPPRAKILKAEMLQETQGLGVDP